MHKTQYFFYLKKNSAVMNYSKKAEVILLKLIAFLFIVFFVNCKKPKKQLLEPEDNSEDFNADVFCKKISRLIRMEKADEIFVVASSINSSILLQCKYCEERDNGLPKIWSRQKHIFTGNITEVETDMGNNVTSSSLFISKSHSLIFRSLKENDIGLYFCKAPYIDSPEKSFNYLIDLSTKPQEEVRGTLTDLKNFTQFYLAKVNLELSNQMFFIHRLSFKMKVFTDWSDWSDWSECASCFRREGMKYRLGRCRVKPICQDAKECAEERNRFKNFVFSDKQNLEKPNNFEGEVTDVIAVEQNIMEFGIALSCRSLLLLKLMPELYKITSTIPDFVLSEKRPTPFKGKTFKRGAKYRKSIILAKGAHLTLVCPESTIDSEIFWEHNKHRLYPSEGNDYVSGINEPRQYVDSFNTLYLFEITDKESGNYTCFVDGVRMQEVKIIVLTRSLFFTKEFTRHLKYLGFVFLICFAAYLSGVIIMFIRSQSENRKIIKKNHKGAQDCEKLIISKDESENESY